MSGAGTGGGAPTGGGIPPGGHAPVTALAENPMLDSTGAPHRFVHLLIFSHTCPCVLGTPSPVDTGLCAYSDKVAGGSSPTVMWVRV